MDFSNRPLAVVTGASNGIGYELSKQFASNGFDLLVTATDAKIDEVAADFRALGATVQTVKADLSTYEGVETLYQKMRTIGQPVDTIALNAGVGVGSPFTETDLDEELNLIDLNVVSVVHLAKRVVKDMVERGTGRLLFTSSVAAIMPGPFEAVYAASKAFVKSFAEGLRNELKDSGISVTAFMPGPTETNFFHRAGMDETRAGADPKDDPEQVAEQAFKALIEGKDSIVTGSLKTKILGNISKILPDTANAEQHRQLTEPGSADR
jgi:short-subunit dehydrogenase